MQYFTLPTTSIETRTLLHTILLEAMFRDCTPQTPSPQHVRLKPDLQHGIHGLRKPDSCIAFTPDFYSRLSSEKILPKAQEHDAGLSASMCRFEKGGSFGRSICGCDARGKLPLCWSVAAADMSRVLRRRVVAQFLRPLILSTRLYCFLIERGIARFFDRESITVIHLEYSPSRTSCRCTFGVVSDRSTQPVWSDRMMV